MSEQPSSNADSGSVLVVFVAATTLVAALMMMSLTSIAGVQQHLRMDEEQYRLRNIGDALVTLAANEIWEGFCAQAGNNQTGLGALRQYLDASGFLGAQGSGEPGSQPGPTADILATELATGLGLPQGAGGARAYSGARVLELTGQRRDVGTAVLLTVRATVAFAGDSTSQRIATVEQTFSLEGEEFNGFGFALLANNVNCIMCHARIDDADRFYNRDPELTGTFPRVRVGTLESLLVRSSSADSAIAGTLYTRGGVLEKDGTPLSTLEGTTVMGFAFDTEGRILETPGGGLTDVPLVLAQGDPLPAGGQFYMNYPQDPELQVDGILPDRFPSVIPDENGNKIVDPDEFQEIASGASGSLTGGFIVKVPEGSSYAGSGLPQTSGESVFGQESGNVLLYGTETNPLVINGRIAVDGDIAIAGVVKGTGEIIASRNVYVLGDLVYADGVAMIPSTGETARTFGVAADGTRNKLAIGAGGNILVGDFLTEKPRKKKGKKQGGSTGSPGVITGTDSGGFNFTLSEITLFNRMEWTRTQPQLPGPGGAMVANPLYDPSYVPRYYTVNPGDPVYLYVGSDVYFDPASRSWLGKEHMGNWDAGAYLTISPGSPEYQSAVISSFAPAASWLDSSQLISLWTELSQTANGEPFSIDGLLYTNNSIMAIVRKSSDYAGRMTVNGSVVAADVGILVPGNGDVGLQLNYDVRQGRALNIRDTGKVVFRRLFAGH